MAVKKAVKTIKDGIFVKHFGEEETGERALNIAGFRSVLTAGQRRGDILNSTINVVSCCSPCYLCKTPTLEKKNSDLHDVSCWER